MSRPRLWLYLIVFLIVASAAGGAVLALRRASTQPVEITLSRPARPPSTGKAYVSGAVANPGAYVLKENDSIADLLADAALSPDADLNSIRVHVPKKGEERRPQRVDINRAEPWLLGSLPGIGDTRAQAIVEYRTRNGPFNRPEDLLKVTGISRGILDRILPLITVAE